MAPLFEPCSEMNNIIVGLKKKRPDIFDFVDPGIIGCGLRVDKNPPKSQKWTLKIEGIRGSKTLINPTIKYIIWAYESSWSDLSDVEKYGHVANMLLRIKTPTDEEILDLATKGEEWEWGKLKAPDIVDLRSWVRSFGVDWDEQGDEMIDILDAGRVPELR